MLRTGPAGSLLYVCKEANTSLKTERLAFTPGCNSKRNPKKEVPAIVVGCLQSCRGAEFAGAPAVVGGRVEWVCTGLRTPISRAHVHCGPTVPRECTSFTLQKRKKKRKREKKEKHSARDNDVSRRRSHTQRQQTSRDSSSECKKYKRARKDKLFRGPRSHKH